MPATSTPSRSVCGDTMVVMSLTDAGRALVLDEWARRLTVAPDVVRSPGTTFVPREGADAVVVVRLGLACVVLAPEPALARLRGVEPDLLVDVGTVAAGVSPLGPRPIGVATLGYRDVPTVGSAGDAVEVADSAAADALQARCGAEEWAESGLASMSLRWVCRTADGGPAALAGHEPWGKHIAHLGIVAATVERRKGCALSAASAAVEHAVGGGLVAQWRSRVSNTASERLAGRLGFTLLGLQLAVALERVDG